MMYVRKSLPLAAVATLCAGLAACSSGSAAGSEGPGSPIKLRSIASVGSGLSNYPDVEAGAKAAVEAINKNGGVNGRQIEYSFCNTGGDANKAMACAREAVEDGVAAVVGRADIFSETTTPILEQAGIPDIGIFTAGSHADATSSVSYPLTSGNFGTYLSSPYVAKEAGARKFAVVGVDVSLTHTQAELVAQTAADAGYEDAEVIWVPAQGVTDYAPYAQSLKETGADFALTMLGPERTQNFYKAAEAIGLETRLLATAYSYSDAEAQATGPAADGTWVTLPFSNPLDMTVEGIAEYNKELDEAGIADDLTLRRPAGLNAWLAVHAAGQVAGSIDGEITSESMRSALDKTTGLDIKGLVTWSPSELGADGDRFPRLPAHDVFVYEFTDGALAPVDLDPIPDPVRVLRGAASN